jgi:hypothetical protein
MPWQEEVRPLTRWTDTDALFSIHSDMNRSKERHSRESGNPDSVPAKAGNQDVEILDSPVSSTGQA